MNKCFVFLWIPICFYVLSSCSGGGGGGSRTADAKVAFVTSATGTGNFSSWNEANGSAGIEAANEICQTVASNAGLSGGFRAYVSDMNTDAYCNILERTGKKANFCGETSLPTGAGPWVRMDGTAFAGSIELAFSDKSHIFTPIMFDENTDPINSAVFYYTGTNIAGEYLQNNSCSDWTDAAGTNSFIGGSIDATRYSTSEGVGGGCDGQFRLMCMQTGKGVALPITQPQGKLVFLTSTTGSGDLNSWTDGIGKHGLDAGDAICQARADAAGHSGNFIAYLSDSTTNAKDRLPENVSWHRVDGIKVADNRADLLDGTLFTSINVTETSEFADPESLDVLTGTNANGLKTGYSCGDWSSTLDGTHRGMNDVAFSGWSKWNLQSCNLLDYHLYCFEI